MAAKTVYVAELGLMDVPEIIQGEGEITSFVTRNKTVNPKETASKLTCRLGFQQFPAIKIALESQLEKLFILNGNEERYCERISELLLKLKSPENATNVINFVELMQTLPGDLAKLEILIYKLLDLPKEVPGRSIKEVITALVRLNVTELDLAIKLVEVANEAGISMVNFMMDFSQEFVGSRKLTDLFVGVAKLGSIHSIVRLTDLIDYYWECGDSTLDNLAPIMQMIESGQKVEAIMTLKAFEEIATLPANLPFDEMN